MFRTTGALSQLLCFRQVVAFSYMKEGQTALTKTLDKVRRRQTVTDVKKLQSYLGEATKDKNLNTAFSRTARYDQEFKEFLKDYQEKNKEFASIIDLSHYAQDQSLSKNQQMRKEEIMMLEEFRRRKQEKTMEMESDDEESKDPLRNLDKVEEEDEDEEILKNKMAGRFSRDSMTQDMKRKDEFKLEEEMQTLYGDQKFVLCILDRGGTTLVTTLNRVFHFRYLVFMGNCNGIIGYGKGKGGNYQTALKNAIYDCKKNLVALNLDHFNPLNTPIKVRYNGMKLILEPRRTMNGWGSPIMGTMLVLSGFTNLSFSIIARNPTPYMLVYTLFKALVRARTSKEMAEGTGYKIYHNNYTSWQYSNNRSEIIPNSGPALNK